MKNNKVIRYVLFWVYTLFALIIPCVLVAEQYGLFKLNTSPSATKICAGAIIIIFLTLFYFRKQLAQHIVDMPPCALKSILTAIKELLPLIILYTGFFLVKLEIESVDFILKWSCLSNIVALVARIYHLRYKDICKEEYEKSKIKEALEESKE